MVDLIFGCEIRTSIVVRVGELTSEAVLLLQKIGILMDPHQCSTSSVHKISLLCMCVNACRLENSGWRGETLLTDRNAVLQWPRSQIRKSRANITHSWVPCKLNFSYIHHGPWLRDKYENRVPQATVHTMEIALSFASCHPHLLRVAAL